MIKRIRPTCFGEFDESKQYCNRICRHGDACITYKELKKEGGGNMFEIKKISVTKVNHFATATAAIEAAEQAIGADAFEIRATTDKGDLQLTIDDLKKIADGEPKDEVSAEQPVE